MEPMENHQWMLSVLSDLEQYSRLNNLKAVQEKVTLAREAMLIELASKLESQLNEKETKP